MFYLTKLPKDFKSSKKFFQFYSSSIATKQNKNSISKIDCIISDDQVIDSEADIANIFNNHFTSLRSEYKYSIEECNGFINTNFKANRNLMPIHSLNGSFNFRFVSEELIKKTLDSLDNISSPGVSLIPVRMLKEIHCKLVPFLTKLFNDSISIGSFPDEFKFAIVKPLFKQKGNATDTNNYRGILILPPTGKLFEKILAEQIRIYFNINNLFCPMQHGFRNAHSCESALHEVISSCLNNMDSKLLNLYYSLILKKLLTYVTHSFF